MRTPPLPPNLDALQRIVDAVPAMLAYWDASERCVFANRAYQRWFGVSPDALIGRTMLELLGPLYPLNLPHIRAALRGEPQEFEREIPDPNGGSPRQSLANYLPHVEDGRVHGFSVLVTEITRQKNTEAALRDALAHVKTLSGLLPICSWCKKIQDQTGQWTTLEKYVVDHTEARITHGMCEVCFATHFPGER